jgi:hypothetical protein
MGPLRFNAGLNLGAFDEEDRAYATRSHTNTMRVQHVGPLGRRAFTRTRLQVVWRDCDSASAFETPTIRVNDAFNRGGAQIAGGQHARSVGIGSDPTTSAAFTPSAGACKSTRRGCTPTTRRTISARTRSRAWMRFSRRVRAGSPGGSATRISATRICRAPSMAGRCAGSRQPPAQRRPAL